MKRRRRHNMFAGVSLFPFLAVLICTFGVLIVLLVLVVKSADHDKQTRIAKENSVYQEQVEEVESVLGMQKLRVDGLTSIRPKLRKSFADKRKIRAHLENEIEKAKEKLEYQKLVVSRIRNVNKNSQGEIEQSKTDLQQQLAEVNERLESLLQQAEAYQTTTYSIVPYHGSNGTNRRPIFIECTKNKLTVQPHGIEINRSEFVDPKLPGNPLDAALAAIREYYVKLDLLDHEGFPYPLLVVRPDGAESYVMARRAMAHWDDEFGYELVSADKPLDFGKQDDQLAAIVREAVNESKQMMARVELSKLQHRRLRSRDVRRAGGLSASSTTMGGFVNEDGVRPMSHQNETSEAGSVRHANQGGLSEENSNDFLPPNQAVANQAGANQAVANRAAGDGGRSANRSSQAGSIANERGEGWALPTRAPGAVGYLRPVRIYCDTDRLVIDTAQGDGVSSTIMIGDSVDTAVVELVEALWKKIDSWGIAAVNGYWRPHLKVFVMPGAQTRYGQMKNLLHNSGLEVEAINE